MGLGNDSSDTPGDRRLPGRRRDKKLTIPPRGGPESGGPAKPPCKPARRKTQVSVNALQIGTLLIVFPIIVQGLTVTPLAKRLRGEADPQFPVLIHDPARGKLTICQKPKNLAQTIHAI